MNKIFCFGDGYAMGHIWPEWPQILQALVPNRTVVITAGVGAGAEFLVSGFVDQIPDMQGSTIIFQWPQANRFDKLIQDNSWQEIISNDDVYNFNVNSDYRGRSWWLSSASNSAQVKEYHSLYIQRLQHQRRLEIYKELVSQTAANLKCCLVHTSTDLQCRFSNISRFNNIRQKEVQPSPPVHFYWLVENIIPQTDIVINTNRLHQLERLLNQTCWHPYDPDRAAIWESIVELLN